MTGLFIFRALPGNDMEADWRISCGENRLHYLRGLRYRLQNLEDMRLKEGYLQKAGHRVVDLIQ